MTVKDKDKIEDYLLYLEEGNVVENRLCRKFIPLLLITRTSLSL
jgi:hypothetical protein